jgi:Protein of unknown function (DUF1559)
MLKILLALACAGVGQAPPAAGDDPRGRAVAPFLDTDVLAVVQLDLARGNLGALTARVAGEGPRGDIAEVVKGVFTWSERLKQAGVREAYGIVSLDDMPGLPVVVVPLAAGADADQIGRILRGQAGASAPIAFPACATIRDAVVAGTPKALERIRNLKPTRHPDLSAAFAAVGDESIGLRMLVLPSDDTRRVFEELIPNLPRELGGGPITQWTRGMRWVAAGLDGRRPSLHIVVASPDSEAAKTLERTGRTLVAALNFTPVDREIPILLARVKSEVVVDRIRVTADAEVVAGVIDAVVGPMREAAAQVECTNNEKQILLAMHNYASSHKYTFPPAYTTSKDGKPLLSWRVLILPYLDQQQALYKEFHVDEPWDSPHNRTLIAKMPKVYRCPLESKDGARDGKTRYLAPRGPNTVFRGAEPVALKEITDGMSNTIVLVDAGDEQAVTWTKPDDGDVPPQDEAAFKAIFRAHRQRRRAGTVMGFGDGAVRFLQENVKPATIRALATYNQGETILSHDF